MWQNTGRTQKELVDKLRQSGIIRTECVYNAMLSTDRGNFTASFPYDDAPQSIGFGATISAPHMHAYALEELSPSLQKGNRVLDVGSGTGYLTVCAARLVGVAEGHGKVVGIDVIPELIEIAKKNVALDFADLLNCPNFILKVGNGWETEEDLFDAIHVGAAAVSVPEGLLRQLAPNGIMIIPIGPQYGVQTILRIVKDNEGKVIEQTKLYSVSYVPLVQHINKN